MNDNSSQPPPIDWNRVKTLYPSGSQIQIQFTDSSRPLKLEGSPKEYQEMLTALQAVHPARAQKSAFDVVDHVRSSTWILFSSLTVALGLISVMYISDGLHTAKCDRALPGGTIVPAEFTTARKSDTGETRVRAKFTKNDGTVVEGRRKTWMVLEKEVKSPKELPPLKVVYVPSMPSCWDIVAVQVDPGTGQESYTFPTLRRRFVLFFTMLFGSLFVLSGVAICAMLIIRRARRKPYVAAAQQFLSTVKLG